MPIAYKDLPEDTQAILSAFLEESATIKDLYNLVGNPEFEELPREIQDAVNAFFSSRSEHAVKKGKGEELRNNIRTLIRSYIAGEL